MEWSGQQKFVSSSELPFTVDGAEAGLLKTYGPLSFLKVYLVNANQTYYLCPTQSKSLS